MQRVHVLCHTEGSDKTHGLDELNTLLKDGWGLSKIEPMSVAPPVCGGNNTGGVLRASFAVALILSKAT